MRLSHLPTRLAAGAFIVNAGLTKLSADDDTAKALHGMASGTYPIAGKFEPQVFVKVLAVGEIALGSTILTPFVPSWLAGGALTGFSGGLLRMYLKTPGLTMEDGIRPTASGTAIAKDSWLFGIGLSLLIDGLGSGASSKRRRRRTKRKIMPA